MTLDNLYCDGEVSVDGHSWSDSAYATDFNERYWPPTYAGRSNAERTRAYIPSAGHLWDVAQRKGLTYRSYGEYAARASTGTTMDAAPGVSGLVGHVSRDYGGSRQRDTGNIAVFLREFREYEKNYDSPDPEKRFPNFVIMSMPEDHTRGTEPGAFTPQAMVANNDYAIGQLVDAVSHSKYWPNTAIFIIEDDAQDGPDHVDARRTVGLVLSPYVKRGIVDSTLYSTSSFVRSIELLLGMTSDEPIRRGCYAALRVLWHGGGLYTVHGDPTHDRREREKYEQVLWSGREQEDGLLRCRSCPDACSQRHHLEKHQGRGLSRAVTSASLPAVDRSLRGFWR